MWKLSEIHRNHSWLESISNTIFISKYFLQIMHILQYIVSKFGKDYKNLFHLTSICVEVSERYYVLNVKSHLFFLFSIQVNLIKTYK